MKLKKDLIIVHFQEGFFNTSNQLVKNTVKTNLQRLVDAAMKTDIHVSFWEDNTIENPKSVITIPALGEKVSVFEAPAGVNLDYTLRGPEVILTGGWFGACINNAIESIMTAFFNASELVATGELTIRLPENAVYKSSEVLADMLDANIKNGISSAFDNSFVPSREEVQKRGLQLRIVRAKTQVTLLDKTVVPAPNGSTSSKFHVLFLID